MQGVELRRVVLQPMHISIGVGESMRVRRMEEVVGVSVWVVMGRWDVEEAVGCVATSGLGGEGRGERGWLGGVSVVRLGESERSVRIRVGALHARTQKKNQARQSRRPFTHHSKLETRTHRLVVFLCVFLRPQCGHSCALGMSLSERRRRGRGVRACGI